MPTKDHKIAINQPTLFTRFANHSANIAGKSTTFSIALLLVFVWSVTGPYFNYSSNWKLVIGTVPTVMTFLMVFLLQNTQNRDGIAMQAKLDELIRASDARNSHIGIEDLTHEELIEIREKNRELQT